MRPGLCPGNGPPRGDRIRGGELYRLRQQELGSRAQVRLSFWKVVEQLGRHYGPPSPPASRDPFDLILYENIAYLVSDDKREKAFRELKKRVGPRPADVLTASLEQLTEITAMGGIF